MKGPAAFRKRKNIVGRSRYCKACVRKLCEDGVVAVVYSLCSCCDQIKPASDFARNKASANKLSSVCRACSKTNRRTLRYGVSPDQFMQMRRAQNYRCGICCKKISGGEVVDHCHESGKVRELLCRHCNLGLGHFDDSEEVLQNAIYYLRRHIAVPQNVDFEKTDIEKTA
jgi:hypothetical protein